MLCIGSIYGWSLVASFLIDDYGFTGAQTQLIFGFVIAIFPVTMIVMGQIEKKLTLSQFCYIAGILFATGYLLAGNSNGNFYLLLIGIGFLGGIATGIGYWISLNTAVTVFPERKGLVTGIISAGFGLGAVVMSQMATLVLGDGGSILKVLTVLGLVYGSIIFISGSFIRREGKVEEKNKVDLKPSEFLRKASFHYLFMGMFAGTFAGLLVVGGLAIIGAKLSLSNEIIVLSISIFAFANFTGRVVWGFISDKLNIKFVIFVSLLFQSCCILLLNIPGLTSITYLIIVTLIGFGFGSNFVLYAKKTAQSYGVTNFGVIYPFVYVGKSLAGLTGPLIGGLFYDLTGSFLIPIILASLATLAGSILYLFLYRKEKRVLAWK